MRKPQPPERPEPEGRPSGCRCHLSPGRTPPARSGEMPPGQRSAISHGQATQGSDHAAPGCSVRALTSSLSNCHQKMTTANTTKLPRVSEPGFYLFVLSGKKRCVCGALRTQPLVTVRQGVRKVESLLWWLPLQPKLRTSRRHRRTALLGPSTFSGTESRAPQGRGCGSPSFRVWHGVRVTGQGVHGHGAAPPLAPSPRTHCLPAAARAECCSRRLVLENPHPVLAMPGL